MAKAPLYQPCATDKNSINAMNPLGMINLSGSGSAVDYSKASDLFFGAASMGHAAAQSNSAFLYAVVSLKTMPKPLSGTPRQITKATSLPKTLLGIIPMKAK